MTTKKASAPKTRPKLAAFDQGQIPTIACFSQATVSLGVDLAKLVAALQKFTDQIFFPVWGATAQLKLTTDFLPGAWAVEFLDDADTEGALGYHDLTPDGLPLAKIFVRTTIADGGQVSVTASHELAEMLVDPAINLCSTGPDNLFYAYETCDAVEEESFALDGIPLSDFVYPAWFEGFRTPSSAQFDHLGKVTQPFQILPGGYMPVFKSGEWTQIFGSEEKAARFAREDRRGHRTELRGVPPASWEKAGQKRAGRG